MLLLLGYILPIFYPVYHSKCNTIYFTLLLLPDSHSTCSHQCARYVVLQLHKRKKWARVICQLWRAASLEICDFMIYEIKDDIQRLIITVVSMWKGLTLVIWEMLGISLKYFKNKSLINGSLYMITCEWI